MAQKDFKTLYKSQYSSQGTLANEVLPNHVDLLMRGIDLMEAHSQEGVLIVLSSLAKLIPPFKKFMRNYEKLIDELNECRKLKESWQSKHSTQWPITLTQKLYLLYQKWWEAYNDSGAGLGSQIYIPRDTRIKQAIQNL